MSRIDELKKQYPELNVSLFDIFKKLDTSKTYKYLPLFCKIFGTHFNLKKQYPDSHLNRKLEFESSLINKGISTNDLSDNELFFYNHLSEFFPSETFSTIKEFMYYMDKNQIDKTDITSYSSLDELRGAITLAAIKDWKKELEGQIVKEHEDDTWLCVRPLTFSSSTKYGAATRWCTTYQSEKSYFEKYWRNGNLCYFINKKTGYKFAGFREFSSKELSFWSASDNRVDYLDLEVDEYMFPIIRKIFSSELTNKNLSSDEIQRQVHEECLNHYTSLSQDLRAIYFESDNTAITIPTQEVQLDIEFNQTQSNELDNPVVGRIREIATQHQNRNDRA